MEIFKESLRGIKTYQEENVTILWRRELYDGLQAHQAKELSFREGNDKMCTCSTSSSH